MTLSTEMQFYLSAMVERDDLIGVLADLLGMKLETLEQPDPEAGAFVMITTYAGDFPMGINVSWPPDMAPDRDDVAIAKHLAGHYRLFVATDLPENHPAKLDPFYWCVAEPDGAIVEMAEDISGANERDGLVLDRNSRKLISDALIFPQMDSPLR